MVYFNSVRSSKITYLCTTSLDRAPTEPGCLHCIQSSGPMVQASARLSRVLSGLLFRATCSVRDTFAQTQKINLRSLLSVVVLIYHLLSSLTHSLTRNNKFVDPISRPESVYCFVRTLISGGPRHGPSPSGGCVG